MLASHLIQIDGCELSNNGLSDNSLYLLLSSLSLHHNNFCSLRISHNQIGGKSADIIMKLIGNLRYGKKNLVKLEIANCQVGEKEMREISAELRVSRIKRLSLINTRMSKESEDDICELVGTSNQLQELNLSWNKFSMKMVGNLTNVLRDNYSIQHLNLSWIPIQETTPSTNVSNLCEMIELSSKLQVINLSHCNLSLSSL